MNARNMEAIARRRVRRGIRKLQEVKPDWLNVVNEDTLRMTSMTWCVLGQSFTEEYEESAGEGNEECSYSTGLNLLFPDLVGSDDQSRQAKLYGFDADYHNDIGFYLLDSIWQEEIAARRAFAKKAASDE